MIQQGTPTVGDTVTIVRHIVAPPGAVIDARAPIDSSIATLVGPPLLTREGDSVRIAYTVAVWTAGHNDVVFPGVVIVDQRGRVDTLPEAHVPVDVSTVLPARAPGTIAPHPARPWLIGENMSALPFAVLLPLAIALVVLLQWRWRRRGPAPTVVVGAPPVPPFTEARIAAWTAAGESRLALEHLDAALRDRADCAEWRAKVATVRFADGNEALVDELVREGSRLASSDAPVTSIAS